MPKNSQRAKWNTANARLANKPFDKLFDGSFRSTQEIADSMQSFTPVIQWGAVSQKWHVTFLDWTDEIYTGNTIRQALEAAEQDLHLTGGILPDLQALSTPQHLSNLKADSIPPIRK